MKLMKMRNSFSSKPGKEKFVFSKQVILIFSLPGNYPFSVTFSIVFIVIDHFIMAYWNRHVDRRREMQLQEPDLPSIPPLFTIHPNLIRDREAHLKHLFTEEELRQFTRDGKIHILRNIPPSTLGYYKGECLVSINEPPMQKVDLEEIVSHVYETHDWKPSD